jgi:tetratricopeptide (TPR) repeat protein/predicted ATP-binding protein involved in virulence
MDISNKLTEKGCDLLDNEDYSGALELFEQALKIAPKDTTALLNKGAAQSNLGKNLEARRTYEEILLIDPDSENDPVFLHNRGRVHIELGNYLQGLNDLNRALKKSKNDTQPSAELWYDRGIALSALGRYNDAIKSYKKSLEIKPDDADVLNNMGFDFRELGKDERAKDAFEKALKLQSEDAYIWESKGELFYSLEEYDKAAFAFNKALDINPNLDLSWIIDTKWLQKFENLKKYSPENTLLITPDGKSKIWTLHHELGDKKFEAQHAFIGKFCNLCSQYANKYYPDNWVILSTKYGLISPNKFIENYDIEKLYNQGISVKKITKQAENLRIFDKYTNIIFLGNNREYSEYIELIKTIFSEKWLEFPLIHAENQEEMWGILSDAIARDSFPLRNSLLKIKKIEIKGLLKSFSYEIPLNTDENITILTAPNGYGKTTILKLIQSVFAPNLLKIFEFPFREISIHFIREGENIETKLIIKKTVETTDNIKSTSKEKLKKIRPETLGSKLSISLNFEYFDDKGVSQTCSIMSSETDNDNILNKVKKIHALIPPIPINFIPADRLWHSHETKKEGTLLGNLKNNTNVVPIQTISILAKSNSLSNRINSMLTNYAISSQKSDLTYLKSLINKNEKNNQDYDSIEKRFDSINKQRKELETLGFLHYQNLYEYEWNIVKNPEFKKSCSDPVMRKCILSYLDEITTKFKVFENFKNKCELFQEIINELFINTHLLISKDDGMKFYYKQLHSKSSSPGEISIVTPDQLSSGEQHQIIVFFDLIFNCDPGTLVLIDEPEISSHIEWQRVFLQNIQKIALMNRCDFILTTHSPDIMNDKWELVIQLNEVMK